MKKIALALMALTSLMAQARVKQIDLENLELQLNTKIEQVQAQIDDINNRQSSNATIPTSTGITELTDMLEKHNIKVSISAMAAESLYQTGTTNIIQACLKGYLKSLPGKIAMNKVDIISSNTNNDFRKMVTKKGNYFIVNVRYWNLSSNLASHNPSLKAKECFDVAYTEFIKP